MTNREQKYTINGNPHKGKQLFDLSRSFGVLVPTLDSESKDPSSNLGRTLLQFFFDYVDYSSNHWFRRKPINEKKSFNEQTD